MFIIKEKMGRTPPPTKYATIAYVDKKFNALDSKFNNFVNSMNDFVSEQRQFNKEVREYISKHS